MCGRFAQYSPYYDIKNMFGVKVSTCEALANYNVAPSDEVYAVIRHHGENRFGSLRWGFVRSWSDRLLINAREETLSEKADFRDALLNRRCLIPADGFYEWKKEGKHRQPFFFTYPTRPFAFAGLWEMRKDSPASCCIITTEASESVRPVHHRMPVILNPENYESWLDTSEKETETLKMMLKMMLKDCLKELRGYPVSVRVNSVKNNDSGLTEPV